MSALLKVLVQENEFKNPGKIMSFLKEVFRDVLQEMLEAEMDLFLGYSRGADSSCKVQIIAETDIQLKS